MTFNEPDRKRVAFPGTMPFEASVRDYIAEHPENTLEQCAADLGICYAAVAMACESLVEKGSARWESEQKELFPEVEQP